MPVSEVKNLADTEPVVGLIINGKARAYPLRILTWHEIVNDGLGSVPVTVTYFAHCAIRPLSSTAALTARSWTSAPPASCVIPTW